jgi:hypothetical protein
MKRIFILLAPLALMLGAAMALSGVAQAGPVGSKADAQCLTLASKTLGSSFNPSNYTFHGGTAGNDTFTGTDGQSEVFCGFGGDDSIGTLGGGTSSSAARATTMSRATTVPSTAAMASTLSSPTTAAP